MTRFGTPNRKKAAMREHLRERNNMAENSQGNRPYRMPGEDEQGCPRHHDTMRKQENPKYCPECGTKVSK